MKFRANKPWLLAAALTVSATLLPASSAMAGEAFADAIDRVLAGSHRSDRNRARDVYRHPKETLLYFGLRERAHVVEIWPGAGWYTEVLAPLMRDRGRYYAAHYHVDENTHRFYRNSQRQFAEKLRSAPQLYDQVELTGLLPPHVDMAPKGSVDIVLTFRNVHN